MRSIIEDEPTSLAEINVADTELAAIVQRGLRKSPEERWLSIRVDGDVQAVDPQRCDAEPVGIGV